ncbi:TPA: CopG family transcriptional regulator, partial [Acinetobacter baumannii]
WFLRKSRWRIRIMISNEKKRVVVTLTKEVADNLDKIAKQMGLSKSGLITIWVNANGKENEQKK